MYMTPHILYIGKLLPKLRAEGRKVLIFSQFKIMLDVLEVTIMPCHVTYHFTCHVIYHLSCHTSLM